MNKELLERLLYEEENATLDFKRDQYRFARATDDEKSELLKDLLGFANAWRRSEAYILIGIEEVRGGRSNVVGIPASEHLDDHSLQQFVNNRTNQPIRFQYEAFGFEEKQVGIISIAEQVRPFYLKRNYGKLEREKVYVRRGSSTDPTKPASPEEISRMRVGSDQPAAELLVELAHPERDDPLGTSTSWNAEFCKMPPKKTIPDLPRPQSRSMFSIAANLIGRQNENFFRELADFEFVRRLFRPTRFVVKNVGQVPANHVRVELTIPMNEGVIIIDKSNFPDPPEKQADLLINSTLKHIRPLRRYPGAVVIDRNDERFRIEIDCDSLQPGRRVWSDIFYIGTKESGDLPLCGLVLADNLPQPKDFTLNVSISVTETHMTVEDLLSLSQL